MLMTSPARRKRNGVFASSLLRAESRRNKNTLTVLFRALFLLSVLLSVRVEGTIANSSSQEEILASTPGETFVEEWRKFVQRG